MRTLKFDLITDSRFSTDAKAEMEYRLEKMVRELSAIPGVRVITKDPRTLNFGAPEPSVSHRITFYVQKTSRSVTWNDIRRVMHRTYSPPTSFVNM